MGASAVAMAASLDQPPSQPPVQHSFGYTCPDGYPIIVYKGRFFPGLYPFPPPQTAHWTACFVSVGAARRAGYAQAPTPRGYVPLDGFYLAPAFKYLKASCRTAAASVRAAVPCPGLTPG